MSDRRRKRRRRKRIRSLESCRTSSESRLKGEENRIVKVYWNYCSRFDKLLIVLDLIVVEWKIFF